MRSKRNKNMETHDFYCLNCGKSIPLPRKQGFQPARFHRKKLYCPYCQVVINMVECKTYTDIVEFKENFANGLYKEEAAESLSFVEGSVI